MDELSAFKAHLLEEAKEDEVGLWYIISGLRDDCGVVDPLENRRVTLEVVKELLEAGHVQAGYYSPDGTGFEPWPLSPREVIARINSEWDALGREPNIADIVIFMSPDHAGTKMAPGMVRQ